MNLPKALADAVKSVKETLAKTSERHRDARVVGIRARGPRSGRTGNDRRLRRSHRLEQYAHQIDEGDDAHRIISGRFINYGIREHGMAAAMNGMTLHGGIIPYSGTFLVFSDYCRPAIRLAALMGERVIHVMTHDSIGLGEDGPTHQPVEHLAALRAIPNLNLFRPCDAVEAIECWELALRAKDTPSVLALTRQNLPQLRTAYTADNLCAAGAYEIVPVEGDNVDVSIFASGSEVAIAVEAAQLLNRQGKPARVVSVPCFELFLSLPPEKRHADDRRRRGQCRGRGRHPSGLGRDHRLGRRVRRHVVLRRQRPVQGPLPPFRHHAGSGRGCGARQIPAALSRFMTVF